MNSMPRKKRIAYEGAWYHVFNRANGRKTIVFNDYFYALFLNILDDVKQLYNVEIHSFCLMKNHYHILMRTPSGNISDVMWYFGSHFARHINQEINCDGPVFKGRFESLVIEDTRYLLQVSRYIHLNPVEAGIVNEADEYPWSSYAFFKEDCVEKLSFLTTEFILSHFLDRQEYLDFVALGNHRKISNFYGRKRVPAILKV